MNSTNVSREEVVNEFGESGRIYRYTVWLTCIQQLLSIIGIVLNCSLFYITIKHKSLHRIYGFLLAICSLCDALTECGTPLATVLVILRRRIPLLTCCYAQFFVTMGSINSYLNLFAISLDRLAALAFPIFYRRYVTKFTIKYTVLANVFSLTIVVYNVFLAYQFAIEHQEIMVYCEPGDMFQGEAFRMGNLIMTGFTLATVLIYIFMGILLKVIKKDLNSKSQQGVTRRIFKSLAMIMAVIFCCWFMAGLANGLVVPALTAGDPSLQFLLGRLFVQLGTIAGAINLPILYFCSSEYRSILRSEFRLIRLLSALRISFKIQVAPAEVPKGPANLITMVSSQNQNPQQNRGMPKATLNRVHLVN